MKKIEMVDLSSQYEKIKTEVNAEIQAVIDTTSFIKGAKVTDFQHDLESFLNVKHVIPVGNGTDALQIALMALGLKPGDEVITPTFTFIATAEVVALLGLTPVVVDVDFDTYNISLESLRKAITPKTKAIVPVHLFGQNADMEGILALAKEYNLFVVEDACQSIGSEYTFSDGCKVQSGCMGDIGYHHDMVGVNSRLDSIQAAVLGVKLKHLKAYSANRQVAASYYDTAFAGNDKLSIPVRAAHSSHVFHQYTLKLNGVNRPDLIKFLAEKNIPAMVYYPVPLHLQKAYQDSRYRAGDFPVAEKLSACVFSLPMHTELFEEQLEYITHQVLEFVNRF